MIQKIFFFGLFGVLVTSCIGDGTTADQREYLASLKQPIPSKKEQTFIKNLQNNNYQKIVFDTPIIGYVCHGCSSYILKMDCPFKLTENNKDSVILVNKNMALKLYNSVIEDSIIYDFGEIRIEFSVKESEIRKWHPILVRNYPKDSLEKWSGFKVIATEKNKYKRVNV